MTRRTHPLASLLLRLSMVLLLCVGTVGDAYSQSMWERAKQKASSAWNSDTRKQAWSKTKQAASTVKKKASDAWNSDTRKQAWSKTKEAAHSMSEAQMLKSVQYQVPVTGRSFYNFIPDSYIFQLGAKQYREYMASSRRSSNTRQVQQVTRVANRLISATRQVMSSCGKGSELSKYSWEVNLVCNSSANAFCMPGGKIVVYDGILPYAQDDAALACVLGHEIAHAIGKHSSEQMSKTLMSVAGVAVLYAIIASSDMGSSSKRLAALLASAGVTLANLKFSRNDETEADRLGLILAAAAGYDPNAAIAFWQRMGAASKQTSARDWYSTHPSNANRISNIRSFLPEAKKYYKR